MTEAVMIQGEGHDPVSGILCEAADARALFVFAHGAGAPMTHPFMESLAEALAERKISTLRYNFPYVEHGRRRPDHPKRLLPVVASAIHHGIRIAGPVPVFAGGKSMGGRMTSSYVSQDSPPGLQGLVFFGFPLHPAGKPGDTRADHLAGVEVPTLFLQGTRDALADLSLLTPRIEGLGVGATLHVVEGADHSFKVLKRSGRTDEEVTAELAEATSDWMRSVSRIVEAAL